MSKHKTNKKKPKIINRALGFVLLFSIVLVFFFKMYQMFQVDLNMKDLHVLEQKKMRLISETALLEAEVSRLKNIDRINKIAAEKLDLVNNTDELFVLQLKDGNEMQKLAKKYSGKQKILNLAGVH